MSQKTRRILFVEDEPLLGELMMEALSDKGFEVHVSCDAVDALHHLMSGGHADILFTDIDLGEGMDGAELAKVIREIRPTLPVVYASGRRSADKINTVPGSVFLPKPYTLQQVDATLERLVPANV